MPELAAFACPSAPPRKEKGSCDDRKKPSRLLLTVILNSHDSFHPLYTERFARNYQEGGLKIRRVRGGDGGSFSAVISGGVFGTNKFWPLSEGAQRAPVSNSCRPWRSKDAVILDGELELQTLAPVVEVAY
jgi:hypothetical protein